MRAISGATTYASHIDLQEAWLDVKPSKTSWLISYAARHLTYMTAIIFTRVIPNSRRQGSMSF
jgi:hypothetical protein